MLTLEEQLLFLEQQRQLLIKITEAFAVDFGRDHSHIFSEKIKHHIFCFDSVLSSVRNLQCVEKSKSKSDR